MVCAYRYGMEGVSFIFLDCLLKMSCAIFFLGSRSQKAPANKVVRIDASHPSGSLHAYLQAKPSKCSQGNPSLNSVR